MTQDIIQEVKGDIEKIKNAAAAFETFKSDLAPKLGKLDAFDAKKFDDIQKDIAAAVEASQKSEGARKAADDQIKALEEKQKLLETALSRPQSVTTKAEQQKEIAQKATSLFNEFARKGSGSRQESFGEYVERATSIDAETKSLLTKAMSVNSDPDGGYLVTPELGGTIATKVFETSPMRQLASVMTIGTDSLEYILDNDEAGAGWVGETQARPETSTPKLSKLLIPVNEIYAQPKATQKLLDDAEIDIEAWLAAKVAQKFARMENTAFMSGDGILKPRGLLTQAAGTDISIGQVQQVVSGSASTFTYDGLINLMGALKEEYQDNASFIVNRTAFSAMLLLKDGNNTPIFNMAYDSNGGRPFTILGAPLYFASDMPTVATNALAVVYGDIRQAYQIVDRTGVRVLRDPYTDKPFVKFYTTKRVGGAPVNFEAYAIGKIST
jgi:HK97 family phage major capsid protein